MSSNVSSGIELGDSARNQDVWPTDDISDFQLKASTPQNDDEHPVLAGHSATITAAETALSDMTQASACILVCTVYGNPIISYLSPS